MIYSASVNATVSVGESFRFSCNATNFLRLQWVYMTNSTHSHVLSNTSDGRVTISPDFYLQLNNIALEDGGIYQCLLSNNIQCSSLVNTLYVTSEKTPFQFKGNILSWLFISPSEISTINTRKHATYSTITTAAAAAMITITNSTTTILVRVTVIVHLPILY